MNKKKIWIMNHYAATPEEGNSTRHYDIAEELIKRGYSVIIFAAGFNHWLRKERLNKGEKIKRDNIAGIEFVWLRTVSYKKNDIYRIMNMLSFSLKLLTTAIRFEKPDIIIASSPHPLTWISGFLLAGIKKSRFIVEIRDLWPQTAIDMGVIRENGLITCLLKRLEKFIYSKAEKIIVLLPGAMDYITQYGIPRKRIVYIPNGSKIALLTQNKHKLPSSVSVQNILCNHTNSFKALFLGAHGTANHLDNLIEAARIIQDRGIGNIDFIFVGEGPEKEALIVKARQLGLQNVYFYEPIMKNEVVELLYGIDVCIFNLKRSDVFRFGISPNKLFDYLSAGKPVVSACDTKYDIIRDVGCGISVESENPEALANAIISIGRMSYEGRQAMGEKGRKYVLENHTIPILADRLENILI